MIYVEDLPMPHKKPTNTQGRRAEEVAAGYLEDKGFRILARNFRCRRGEIDIVAEEEDQIVFVEVRSLGPGATHLPEETVTPAKQRQVSRAALAYMQAQGLDDRAGRFDVVALEMGSDRVVIRHIADAFECWEA